MGFEVFIVKGWLDTPPYAEMAEEIRRFLQEQGLTQSQVIIHRKDVVTREIPEKPQWGRVEIHAVIIYGEDALPLLVGDTDEEEARMAYALVLTPKEPTATEFARSLRKTLHGLPVDQVYPDTVEWPPKKPNGSC